MVRIFQVIKIAFFIVINIERERSKNYHIIKQNEKTTAQKLRSSKNEKEREREKNMFTKLIKIAQSHNSPKNKVSSLFY